LDDRARGTSPLRDCGDVVSKGSVVNLVYENTEESGRFAVRVGLELGLDVDDECGSQDGEKTGLNTVSARRRVSNLRKKNPQRSA